jgi:nucleotide-binding universal stress UspA family protein
MAKHVLVPTDGSSLSESALDFTLAEWPDADVTLLHVIDPVEAGYSASALPSGSEEWYQNAVESAEGYFEAARTRTGRDDVAGRTEVGRPAKTIVGVAEEDAFDHIVVGSHGREGVSRIVLGSVAEHVVRMSPVPVTVVR